jgi:hypothetical protein
MAFKGISEMIEKPLVLEILHAVHNAVSTFGYSASAWTDPHPDPQSSPALIRRQSRTSAQRFHVLFGADVVIIGE